MDTNQHAKTTSGRTRLSITHRLSLTILSPFHIINYLHSRPRRKKNLYESKLKYTKGERRAARVPQWKKDDRAPIWPRCSQDPAVLGPKGTHNRRRRRRPTDCVVPAWPRWSRNRCATAAAGARSLHPDRRLRFWTFQWYGLFLSLSSLGLPVRDACFWFSLICVDDSW